VGSSRLVDPSGLQVALRRVGSIALFVVLPLVLLEQTAFGNSLLYDFHGVLYEGGRAILHGTDPYRSGFLNRLAALAQAGHSPSHVFAVPVYPAPALAAFSPLSILPFAAAGTVFTLISVAAFVAGLRLLGVRDWRCYGAAFLSSPLLETVWLGQVNGLLVFGLAVVWRWRDRLIAPAVAATCLVMINLFLWPIGLVLLLGRRYRVVALAAGLGFAALVAWAVFGLSGLLAYPRLLSDLVDVEGGAGISLLSAGRSLGASRFVCDLLTLSVTVGLLGLAFYFIRRPGDEARAFGIAVMAGLSSSLVVWPHYLALLFVPIALLSPTLSPLWLVPLLAYAAPSELTHHQFWNIAPYLLIELIMVGAICFWGRRHSPAARIGNLLPTAWRPSQLASAEATGPASS
jgi:hypothetical protein